MLLGDQLDLVIGKPHKVVDRLLVTVLIKALLLFEDLIVEKSEVIGQQTHLFGLLGNDKFLEEFLGALYVLNLQTGLL